MARVSKTYTMVADTPIQLNQGTSPVWAKRIFVQMDVGAAGTGVVFLGVLPRGRVPALATDAGVKLAPSPGALQPGGSFADDSDTDPPDIDLTQTWIMSSATSDKMIVTYEANLY